MASRKSKAISEQKADEAGEATARPEGVAETAESASEAIETAEGESEKLETMGRARTQRSQGKGWDSVLKLAKRLTAARPDDHLSSLLAELREVNIGRKDPGRYYQVKDMVAPVGAGVLGREGKSVDDGFYYPDVANSQYCVSTIGTIRYLSRFIRPNTTAVMELGSGWSSNLFQLYIAHGATRSKKIIYYGGEYTHEGQVCGKFIAGVDSKINYRSFSFDFRKPDVTFLKRQRGHILLFTCHAIEQVDLISPDLFAQLKDIANDVTVVHIEPVGWQRDEKLLKMRQEGNNAFFEGIGAKALQGNIDSVSENAAWWSWRLEYNKNLLPIVWALEHEGSIKMRRTEFDFDGTANVLNPSTLLHYDFVR